MADFKTVLELVLKYPPLLVIAVGLALWVGKGAFFAWHEGYTKFRNRRILDSKDLAIALEATAPAMSAGLKDELESAVFRRFVGVRADRRKRVLVESMFRRAGQPIQFELLKSGWHYLVFSGDAIRVKKLDGWRKWRYWAANASFVLAALLSVAALLVTSTYWASDRPFALTVGIQIPGFLLICWQLLQGIWAYRDAQALQRVNLATESSSPKDAVEAGDPGSAGSIAGRNAPLALPPPNVVIAAPGQPTPELGEDQRAGVARKRSRTDV